MVHDAILAMMRDRTVDYLKQASRKPGALEDHLREGYLSLDPEGGPLEEQYRPGSELAQEMATVDAETQETAAWTWRRLDEPTRQALLTLAQTLGGKDARDDLKQTIELNLPV